MYEKLTATRDLSCDLGFACHYRFYKGVLTRDSVCNLDFACRYTRYAGTFTRERHLFWILACPWKSLLHAKNIGTWKSRVFVVPWRSFGHAILSGIHNSACSCFFLNTNLHAKTQKIFEPRVKNNLYYAKYLLWQKKIKIITMTISKPYIR